MNIYLRRSSLQCWLLIGMLCSFAACGQTNILERKDQKMASKDMTVWQLIEHLGNNMPLRPEKIEQLFEITLSKSESSNQYMTFWDGNGGLLQNGVRVSHIDLGVSNNDEQDLGMLTLSLAGNCLTLDDVMKRYSQLAIVGSPRGHSENDETTFETKTSWGVLVFGFAERNRNCLSSAGFGPKK